MRGQSVCHVEKKLNQKLSNKRKSKDNNGLEYVMPDSRPQLCLLIPLSVVPPKNKESKNKRIKELRNKKKNGGKNEGGYA